jgi:small subunit ribosomal protein S6e
MADFKLSIADPKTGKCVQRELKAPESNSLMGKKIKDKVDGGSMGLEGYEFEFTGGSDKGGFPMRWDVKGTSRKKILAIEGVGLKKKAKGIKQRKTVAGNTINETTVQINLKILKEGKEKLFGGAKKGEEKKEAPAEEKPKKEAKVKEAPKEKKEEPKAEKPEEEAKPEEKKE